ncbi:MAG: hypothetical protein IH820_01610 [Bacteroidetes bacterium]|nr:hypothetical protein [Bacteroidota bacterium]
MERSSTMRGLSVGWLCLGLLVAVGCEGEPTYVVDYLVLNHTGWDTLTVEVAFSRRRPLRRSEPLQPRALSVYLFNAAYDTLYAGDGRSIPIADATLGDRERLMVEVCGTFDAVSVCEQQGVTASPKRLRLEHDIHFPEDAAFERGSYDLRFVVERQAYETGAWESLGRPDRVHGYLLAYVGDQNEEAVKVPFSRRQGRFILKGRPHYNDFQYHLKSMLMDAPEAPVRFDVYAGLNGQPALRLASVEKRVQKKTEEERILEVHHFAEEAVEQIFEALEVDHRERWSRAYIDQWTFQALTNTYRIALEIVWRRGRFAFGKFYELEGVLEVEENGANARFIRRDANDRAARRWGSRIRGNQLSLGMLAPYVPDEENLTGEEVASGEDGFD